MEPEFDPEKDPKTTPETTDEKPTPQPIEINVSDIEVVNPPVGSIVTDEDDPAEAGGRGPMALAAARELGIDLDDQRGNLNRAIVRQMEQRVKMAGVALDDLDADGPIWRSLRRIARSKTDARAATKAIDLLIRCSTMSAPKEVTPAVQLNVQINQQAAQGAAGAVPATQADAVAELMQIIRGERQ